MEASFKDHQHELRRISRISNDQHELARTKNQYPMTKNQGNQSVDTSRWATSRGTSEGMSEMVRDPENFVTRVSAGPTF